jgi:hypothetical protein
MANQAEEFVPKIVTEWISRVDEATGCISFVERIDVRTWRMVTESERVRLTLDFKNGGNGKVKRSGSTLAVDGAPRELAKDFEHLIQIFNDPDESKQAAGVAKAVEVKPMPPLRSPEDAPLSVRTAYEALIRAGKPAEIGEKDGCWVVGFESDTRALRMAFQLRRKQWHLTIDQLIIDGVDRSQEAGGDIVKAIELLGGEVPSITRERVIGSPSSSARSNAVETRRATVIRN